MKTTKENIVKVKNSIEESILKKIQKAISSTSMIEFIYDLTEEEMFYFYKNTQSLRNGDGLKKDSFVYQISDLYVSSNDCRSWQPYEFAEEVNKLIRVRVFHIWEKKHEGVNN